MQNQKSAQVWLLKSYARGHQFRCLHRSKICHIQARADLSFWAGTELRMLISSAIPGNWLNSKLTVSPKAEGWDNLIGALTDPHHQWKNCCLHFICPSIDLLNWPKPSHYSPVIELRWIRKSRFQLLNVFWTLAFKGGCECSCHKLKNKKKDKLQNQYLKISLICGNKDKMN